MKSWQYGRYEIKWLRWRYRRALAALRWGPERLAQAPIVFGNAIPKSGSHLISQILHGLSLVGPFVLTGFPPINRDETNHKLSGERIMANLEHMRPGDIGYGYLGCEEPFIGALTSPQRATVFVYRDPRDVIVSSAFYIFELNHSHALHRYYKDRLGSIEKCIEAEIRGIKEPGYEYSGVCKRFEKYMGWLDQPAVLTVRFEDLVLNREAALDSLLDYVEARGAPLPTPRPQAVAALQGIIQPGKSGTFRKGQPGNWKEHFTASNKALFKEIAGDILIRLGYERDDRW